MAAANQMRSGSVTNGHSNRRVTCSFFLKNIRITSIFFLSNQIIVMYRAVMRFQLPIFFEIFSIR